MFFRWRKRTELGCADYFDERPEAVQYIFKAEQQATQRPHGRNQIFVTGLA